jgi:hypothetical protein
MRRLLLALFALALLAAFAPTARAQQITSPADEAAAAAEWVRGQQQSDGSFPGFSPGDTADAVVALLAAGGDQIAAETEAALDYLKAQAAGYAAGGPGAAAKLALAAVAAGENPASFGGVNLLQEIGKGYDPATGQYGPDVYGHALALLAAKAVEAAPAPLAVGRLLDLQLEDGGWSFDGTAATGSDTNTTSLALQALAGLRQADGARAKAIAYLKTQQNDDGGFPYSQTAQFGNDSDANSTAASIQAIIAAGQDPGARAWTKGRNTPYTALVGLQNSSGALRFQAGQPDDNGVATYQAVPALFGRDLPLVTASAPGAAALLAPSAAALPATGAADGLPAAALTLLALALLAGGVATRRAAR